MLHAPRAIQASLLHPLADADTPRRELAKASSRREGQDEERFAPFKAPSSVMPGLEFAYCGGRSRAKQCGARKHQFYAD